MSQPPPYPYQPNGAMQRYADDPSAPYGVPPGASSLATRSIRPTMVNTQPYPGQANYIIHTDDASTKLSDRVRRKCYNCRTTDTSTWRRSSLTPGKVLCNKCGLFERTHSRPRPEQFPHKRGPVVTQFKQQAHRGTPPPAQMAAQTSQQLQQQRLPSMNAQMLPPHHYSHPSLSPLMAARSADPNQQQQQYRQSGVTEIGALLNGPGEAQSASVGGSPRQAPQQPPMSQQEHQQHQHQHQHQQSTHGVKRPGSPLEQPMHQQPTPEAHGHASPQIAAGSIPNSPRNERREAPSASSTAAAAAAAHRAGN
ncbi:hypothetical protein L227DRAFT_586984 [Lentinus tigrinus ALCF2SS1-6]|uniref:GATA-type domain-containing protein n=2 Tax=Lentinus tigrinus TaxID=5365 RepID=A0A5C2SBX9_9APHY|nr:hypothetical protein L227DRAFT_586984 [Lentinus tigrinus ALCF2SS1-6]